MKKTTTFFLSALALMAFAGCEADTVEFDTNLKTTVLSDIQEPLQTAPQMKVAATYPFSTTQTLSLDDNEKVEKYLNKLKDIDVKSIKCTFTGIPEGQTITELQISIPEVALVVNLTNLTNNTVLTLDVPKEKLTAIGNKLLDNHQISITVTGESTYAPMTLSSALDFAASIKAKVLDL